MIASYESGVRHVANMQQGDFGRTAVPTAMSTRAKKKYALSWLDLTAINRYSFSTRDSCYKSKGAPD